MTVLTFTPARFAVLLLASVGIALGTSNRGAMPRHLDESGTSNYLFNTSFTPTPRTYGPGRTMSGEPQMPPAPIRRSYPPLAR